MNSSFKNQTIIKCIQFFFIMLLGLYSAHMYILKNLYISKDILRNTTQKYYAKPCEEENKMKAAPDRSPGVCFPCSGPTP